MDFHNHGVYNLLKTKQILKTLLEVQKKVYAFFFTNTD